MDQKGNWHNIDAFKDIPLEPVVMVKPPLVKVFELDIGEIVEVVRSNGDKIRARFYKAQGNRIELKTLPLE